MDEQYHDVSERNIKSHYYPLLLVAAAAGLPRRRKQWNAFVFKKSRLLLKSMQINTDNLILIFFMGQIEPVVFLQIFKSKASNQSFRLGLANFFYIRPDSKHFRLCRPWVSVTTTQLSTLPLQCRSNHRQYVNE